VPDYAAVRVPAGRACVREPWLLKVAASLEAQDYRVSFLDLSGVENFLAPLEDYLVTSQDAAIGITATTPQLPAVMQIAKTIRRLRPDLRLILGGPHVTLVYSHRSLRKKRGVLNGRATVRRRSLKPSSSVVQRRRELAIFEALKEDAPKSSTATIRRAGCSSPIRCSRKPAAGAAPRRPQLLSLQHRRQRSTSSLRNSAARSAAASAAGAQQEPAPDPQSLSGVDPVRGRASASRARLYWIHVL